MERLVQALAASMDPVSMMGRIAEQVCAFMPKADGAAVTLLRASDNAYVTVSAHGIIGATTGFVVPRQGSFQGLAARERCPKLIHDAPEDPRLSPHVRAVNTEWGTRSWAVMPLLHNTIPIGSLMLASGTANAFTDADVDALLAISEFVSALIGSQSQLSTLLTHVMTDSDERGQRALTARFIASVMLPDAVELESLQDQLDTLLEHPDSLSAAFQPVVRLATGDVIAYEGLTRFPVSSELAPAQWFRVAARLGSGIALEHLALRTILDAARRIPENCPVAVNLSPRAVLDAGISALLVAQDRPLIVEITEHEPFPDDLATGLEQLRSHGIQIAVDDAGAGYASFTQLLRLRPNMVKIDGELIAGIDDDPVKRALVTALGALASELQAIAVAEAVESAEQLQTLISLGIEYGQGYLFGYPRPVGLPATGRLPHTAATVGSSYRSPSAGDECNVTN